MICKFVTLFGDTMIEDIQKAGNDNMEFHLWGTGAEENSLKDYTQSHGMNNVVFHGAYLRSKQSEVINSCDLVQSLVCGINKFLTDDEFREECRNNVKVRVNERYSIESIWNSMCEIWRQTLK